MVTNATVKILREAAKLLVATGWTKGEYARRKDGSGAGADDPKAVSYCSLGAVYAVSARVGGAGEARWKAERALRAAVCDNTGRRQIVAFNDHPKTNLDDVLEVFKKAERYAYA